ncbi:MAG: hypothetical protein M1320_01325 [Patescibacteria group bacterium]|nr:hypothetical protein [Patescibacteria group bacterium]
MKKKILNDLYNKSKKSVSDIAGQLNCSEHKMNYWLRKHSIKKRSISEAIYIKNNPKGDPFVFRKPKTKGECILFGLGIGLYWGEGTKANKNTIRLGNSDPELIKRFIRFLELFFGIKKSQLKFQLQIFSDLKEKEIILYWEKYLGITSNQLYKTVITPSRSLGTYRKKSSYGVMTVLYGNTKARNILCGLLQTT